MHRTLGLVAIGLLLGASGARAAAWEIDPAHTTIGFSVKHMMVSNVRGQFKKFGGNIDADPAKPTAAVVTATIDAASIDTGNEKRDEHLRSPDFLDVAKFPEIAFKSTKVQKLGAKKWKLTGDLTLHGVTKPVTLDVEGPIGEVKDPHGNLRTGATATTTINRKDFGIAFDKTLDGGGLLVGNEIAITIEVEAMGKAAP